MLSPMHALNDALHQVRREGKRGRGICTLVSTALCEQAHMDQDDVENCMELMKSLWKRWPEYSGERMYPVPHPSASAWEAFGTSWKWTRLTRYGRARRRLLDWLIQRTEGTI